MELVFAYIDPGSGASSSRASSLRSWPSRSSSGTRSPAPCRPSAASRARSPPPWPARTNRAHAPRRDATLGVNAGGHTDTAGRAGPRFLPRPRRLRLPQRRRPLSSDRRLVRRGLGPFLVSGLYERWSPAATSSPHDEVDVGLAIEPARLPGHPARAARPHHATPTSGPSASSRTPRC